MVRENFSFFHTVCSGKNESLTQKKKIRQINSLVITLVKTLLSRNFCQKCVRLNRSNFHIVSAHSVEKWKILSHWKKISSNQLFSSFVSKNVVFTKFLSKKCESKFSQFLHCELSVWNCSFTIIRRKFHEINFFNAYTVHILNYNSKFEFHEITGLHTVMWGLNS